VYTIVMLIERMIFDTYRAIDPNQSFGWGAIVVLKNNKNIGHVPH